MNKLDAIVAELTRRTQGAKQIIATLQPHQLELAQSDCRRRAVIASRRAGKSVTTAAMAHAKCQSPRVRVLWLGLTLTNIRRISEDAMRIVTTTGLQPRLHKGRWVYEYPNGSSIEIAGADSTKDAAERYTGVAWDLVIIDEAGSIDPDVLDYLIDSIIWPALMDRQGVLVLVGTPRRNLAGRYWEVTADPERHPDWLVLRWSTAQNSYVAEQWKAEWESLTPEEQKLPDKRREYLGEWIDDDGTLVYRAGMRPCDSLPEGQWTWVCGIDPGYTDPCGIVVAGWRKYHTDLYVVYAEEKEGMLTSELANKLMALSIQYPGLRYVMDSAAAQTIADLGSIWHIPVSPAEKQDKAGAIDLVNSDVVAGNVWWLPTAKPLLDQQRMLDWIRKLNKLVENPGKPNHLCDAWLYVWRSCQHRFEKPAPRVLTEEERIEKLVRDQAKKLADAARKRKW